MQQLFTLPEVTTKINAVKRDAGDPDISTLNAQQLYIYENISEDIEKSSFNFWLIEGYAGTGKTYLVSRILESYLKKQWNKRVAFTATTNKAVKVAYRSSEYFHPNLEYSTIHRLLGLKELIRPDGTLDFVPDYDNPATIQFCSLVIIDESSMLNMKLFSYILPYALNGVKVVFIGDPCQIPPIKERQSPVFSAAEQSRHKIKVYSLTDIIRQALDNPIIEVTSRVRKFLQSPYSYRDIYKYQDKVWQSNKGVFFLDRNSPKQFGYFDELVRHMFVSPNFTTDADFSKIIVYRNKTGNAVNKSIRRMLFGAGKLRRIEVGEKIITKAPVFEDNSVIIPNAEELQVVDFERREERINDGKYILPFYATQVSYYDIFGTERTKYIKIPTDLGVIAQTKILAKLAETAKAYPSKSIQSSQAWAEFWYFKKAFAEVGYNYCLTSHLAQGSTYQNAIVFESDMDVNSNVYERNRIKYTAFARPQHRLWIL